VFDAALASVRAEALLTATNRFLRSADLYELARVVVDAAESMFAPSQAAVVFRTATGDARVLASTGPRPPGAGEDEGDRRGRPLIDRALAGEELCTDDHGSEEFAAYVRAYGGVSGLALPIRTSAGVGGVLMILYDTVGAIDPRIRELARGLSAQAGLAVELLSARDDLSRQTLLASSLLKVSQRLATLTDPDEVPAALVTAIHGATGASLAAVARWSEEESRVEFTAVEGLTAEEAAALRALEPVADRFGMVQGGLAGRSAVLVPPFDPEDVPIQLVESFGVTAIAGAPITVEDRVWGFLVVATRDGDPSIVETGPELLSGFATMTSTALGRTQAIAALERSRQVLESGIAARTRELTQVVDELRRASVAKTEFLSNVSHELRTPLTSILGFTDLLLHGLEGPLTDAQHEDLRTIEASGGRLLGLIDDLIDVSQIEAGKVELRIDPIALRAFLEDLAGEIRPLAERNLLTLELAFADGPAVVYADEARLRGILANLLTNAVKFTPQGGTIRIEVGAQDEDTLRIDVVDTGIGIAPAEQERVFEKFHRTAAPDVPGTGLGLAIAREYSRLHGGDLRVESTPGVGSRFSLLLPHAAAPPPGQ
jgi:signal transduction histidine kinase